MSILGLLIIVLSGFGQVVFIDDTGVILGDFQIYCDSLLSNGMTINLLSETSWELLTGADVFWNPSITTYYDNTAINALQDFCRNNGHIILWLCETNPYFYPMINDILLDTGWQTSLQVVASGMAERDYLSCISTFPPFTEGVDSLDYPLLSYVECGNNAYPVAAIDSSCSQTVVAISFPFLHNGNCSSMVIVATNGYGFIDRNCSGDYLANNLRFGLNILLAAAGVPGYELEPGAIPGGGNVCEEPSQNNLCSAAPNPFTPNGDGINDEAKFEFPGLGEVPGTIKIFTLDNLRVRTIEVPTGSGAKEAAKWDGRDDSGAPHAPGNLPLHHPRRRTNQMRRNGYAGEVM